MTMMDAETGNTFPKGYYPTLKELRALKETHGPLIEAEWSGSASGMMFGDLSRFSMKLVRTDGGTKLFDMEMKSFQPAITKTYAADDSVWDKLQKIADDENLAAWRHLRADPDKQMIVYDHSSSASISLVFDDSAVGGRGPKRISIGREEVRQQGGSEVWNAVCDILKSCADTGRLLEESTEPNPYVDGRPPFMGMGMGVPVRPDREPVKPKETAKAAEAVPGTWTCPACGNTGNTGKFCPECGQPRKEA